jgi:hypothetical protein
MLDTMVYEKAVRTLMSKDDVLKKVVNLDLHDYQCQLVAFRLGNKECIYFNANSKSSFGSDWKTNPEVWCDGSEGHWGVVYDVKKNKLFDFKTNGPVIKEIKNL